MCNPLFEIDNGSQVSSIDFIDKDHFVTGSWDGCATVWKLSTKSKVSQYKQHKYAVSVYYNSMNDTIISGSQDKALNMWQWQDGKKLKRHENAHNDIIR